MIKKKKYKMKFETEGRCVHSQLYEVYKTLYER